jgi:integrase
MATIESYTTTSGRRYMVRYRKPNRRQTMKRGFRTKRDAERFLAAVEVSKDRGEYIDPTRSRTTIGELGPLWLARQTHLKPSSLRPVEIAWRVHVEPTWADHRVSEVSFSEVQDWVSELSGRRKATTVIRAFGVLSALLEEAVRDRRILTTPCAGVKTPRKVSKAHTYLTHSQVHALAREAKGAAAVVLVLSYTGLRWGELSALRVRDIDLKRRRLNVEQNAVEVGSEIIVGTPKSHERRSVPYPALLDAHLEAACRIKLPDALAFPGPDGRFMRRTRTDESSGGWFAGAVKRSGVPRLTPHDLRHTAASLAVSAGANVKSVQRMLGHKSAAMTLDVYAGLFDDDLDSVAVALNHAAAPYITS